MLSRQLDIADGVDSIKVCWDGELVFVSRPTGKIHAQCIAFCFGDDVTNAGAICLPFKQGHGFDGRTENFAHLNCSMVK